MMRARDVMCVVWFASLGCFHADLIQLVHGGVSYTDPHSPAGCFFTPTVLSHVTHDMRVAREEAFGPIMSVIRYDGEDELVSDGGMGWMARVVCEAGHDVRCHLMRCAYALALDGQQH